MVFVNDVAGVTELPAWMYHVPAEADAMTFVDVVFPAFLIIVGMSIPLAINLRFNKGDDVWSITKHILLRSIGLIVLGVFMVNAAEMNTEENLIPKSWWNVLLYTAAILIWNQYPRANRKMAYLYRVLQLIGIIILLALAVLYRKGEPGALSGMTPSWWGILGLIGWAYLISTTCYMVVKDNLASGIAIFSLLVVISLGLGNPGLSLPAFLWWLKGQSGHFIHASLVFAGIIMTLFIKSTSKLPAKAPLGQLAVLGIGCYIAGFFLRPFYGISKIGATPTWALYSVTCCCIVYILIYWVVDLKGYSKWADFLKPAGRNPLLTYILPFIFYATIGLSFIPGIFNEGLPGVIRSAVFSLLILWTANLLSKSGIRLRL